jgi:hypothetical protein
MHGKYGFWTLLVMSVLTQHAGTTVKNSNEIGRKAAALTPLRDVGGG